MLAQQKAIWLASLLGWLKGYRSGRRKVASMAESSVRQKVVD